MRALTLARACLRLRTRGAQHRLFAESLREEVLPSVEQPREEVESSDVLVSRGAVPVRTSRAVRQLHPR